jgi:hypothetical protein
MSKIKASYDLELQIWDIQTISHLLYSAIDLEIEILSQNLEINFSEFKYGFEILSDDQQVEQFHNYPLQGMSIKSIRSGIIETIRLMPLKIEQSYFLRLYLEINGLRIDSSYKFTVPKPPKIYASWIWDGEKWVPPIPKPILNTEKDGKAGVGAFIWDEEKRDWTYFKES